MGKSIPTNRSQKKAGVEILISNKTSFQIKAIRGFPDRLVINNLPSHCKDTSSIPVWGTKIQKATWNGHKIK